jgi:biopolymer transport protein ExbB
LREVEELLREKKLAEAHTLLRRHSSAMTRILQVAILNHDKEKEEIKGMIEDAARQEMPVLERYLTLLGTLAAIAPLLGLLGTVTGMIRAFMVIAEAGVGTPATLASGIYEALITTAAGLSVAIPTLVFHTYFVNKVDGLVLEMEKHSLRLLDILKR